MPEDIPLNRFADIDTVANTGDYVAALEAFDATPQIQELKTIARKAVAPGDRVLDVGCGFGLETLRLARHVGSGGTVVGIDRSADFISEAGRRAASAGLDVVFRVADAGTLPEPDNAFDHVRAERLLIYLDKPEQVVAEMRRVARPGASLAFIEPEFASTTVNLSDREVVRSAMAHEADTAVAQNWLPGRLSGMLDDLGLADIAIESRIVIFPQSLGATYFATVGRNAHGDGVLTDAELAAWLADIEDLAGRGRLFGTVGYFVFTCRKA